MSKDREKIIEIASQIAIKNLSPNASDSNIYYIGESKRNEIIDKSVESAISLINKVDARMRG
jgi:hypothetical protein